MNAEAALAVVVVRRTIAASADEIFDAWLDPLALAQWMCPDGTLGTRARVEPRVGGCFEIAMETASETILHRGEYRVIDRPRRMVFTWISPPTQYRETLVTVDFVVVPAGTEVIVMHEQLPADARQSHDSGWSSALRKLADMQAWKRLP